jgi:PAS domain S-box-containing protein
MQEPSKTNQELIKEIAVLKQRIQELEKSEVERKQMGDALRESEARFKALHNASFGGIAIHDKGVILDCNKGMSVITGYSIEELTGMDGLLLIAPQSRNDVMANIMAGHEKPYEAMGIRKNGGEYFLRLEARNVPYKGEMVRIIELRDITEQKRAEEQLQ